MSDSTLIVIGLAWALGCLGCMLYSIGKWLDACAETQEQRAAKMALENDLLEIEVDLAQERHANRPAPGDSGDTGDSDGVKVS